MGQGTRGVRSARTDGRVVAATAGMLSIGALARATGIPIETLRTWERRYGFPRPVRKPSGHRVYPVASVPRLRRIAEMLAHGHRAGEVVCASDEALAALLGALPRLERPDGNCVAADPAHVLDLVARFDGDGVIRTLAAEWGRLGPIAFLEQRAAPLVCAVGEAWAAGRLHVRHEHFLSERLGDLLRAYRLPFEERARGPLVVLATLPGELHVLGLQMAALVMAVAGWRVCYVGAETPVDELPRVARDLQARAVGVSVSLATRGDGSVRLVAELRAAIPARMALLLGGAGAPATDGALVLSELAALHAWACAAANGHAEA